MEGWKGGVKSARKDEGLADLDGWSLHKRRHKVVQIFSWVTKLKGLTASLQT